MIGSLEYPLETMTFASPSIFSISTRASLPPHATGDGQIHDNYINSVSFVKALPVDLDCLGAVISKKYIVTHAYEHLFCNILHKRVIIHDHYRGIVVSCFIPFGDTHWSVLFF